MDYRLEILVFLLVIVAITAVTGMSVAVFCAVRKCIRSKR